MTFPSLAYRPTLLGSLRGALGRLSYRTRRRLGLLPESNSIAHARRELGLLRSNEPDEMQDLIERHILKLIREFDKEGHSGFSANYTINLLEKLLRFEPIKPLTGDDSEWNDISGMSSDPCWQNNRCSHVFKGADGRAYDSQGRVFTDADGGSYTSRDSRVYISFPYRPSIQYIRRPKRGSDGRFAKATGK